jgi:restriction system protein
VSTASVPTHVELLWPTLQAVKEVGGSGTIDEINDRVIQREGFTEEQQAVLHNEGPRTKIEYRLAWARTYLKGISALENSERAVWSITDAGRSYSEEDVARLHHEYRASIRAARRERKKAEREAGLVVAADDGEDEAAPDWKEELIALLLELPPDRFEHLARRLLLEAGFISAKVTGRTGDGGIDGIGVYRLSLVSFPVFFQCKRYRGSVRAGAVRDFRGAMAGRGDRGLLITTGTFTAEAKQESTRDGAPPIDLIDGERLCDLLKEHGLGVRTMLRQIEDVSIDRGFLTDT